MGGTSTTSQTQNSTTAPWQAAQPTLNGILGQLGPQIVSDGSLNSAQQGAIGQLMQNAGSASQFAPQIAGLAGNLLNGGGATSQNGALSSNLSQYQANTSPLANNTNYDPLSTPGIGTQLAGLQNSIMGGINGQFAAAGRDGSPANSSAAAYGLAQGLAPILTNQYNQNVQNQQGAAGNLYNAGNTTSGLLTGNNQTALGNQVQGITAASNANDARNATANAQLDAQAQAQGIPLRNLGLLAQIGVPIAGLGSQSTGQSNGSQTMSGAQQFASIGQGVGGFAKGLDFLFG